MHIHKSHSAADVRERAAGFNNLTNDGNLRQVQRQSHVHCLLKATISDLILVANTLISLEIFAFADSRQKGSIWGGGLSNSGGDDGAELISCESPSAGRSSNKGYEQRTHAKDINTSDTFSPVNFELCSLLDGFIFPKYQNGLWAFCDQISEKYFYHNDRRLQGPWQPLDHSAKNY